MAEGALDPEARAKAVRAIAEALLEHPIDEWRKLCLEAIETVRERAFRRLVEKHLGGAQAGSGGKAPAD